ncbi:MAG: hypothetical protein FE834_10765, partial [Gammaproteobacteria bacterium]|nr:hypothetical protein [Gammaproteobacteria bacterium]
ATITGTGTETTPVLIDITPPTLAVNLTNDTGTVANQTNDGTLTVTNTDHAEIAYFVTKGTNPALLTKTASEYQTYINAQKTASNGDGDYSIQVVASDTVGNTTVITKTFTLDTTAPTITNITSTTANGSFKTNDTIDLQVTISENMNTGSTIMLTLEIGTTDRIVTLTRDSTNARLYIGTYTVQAGDTAADLNAIGITTGTTAPVDGAGNALTLTLPNNQNLSDNKDLVIDTIAPIITNITSSTTDSNIKLGDIVALSITVDSNMNAGSIIIATLETGVTDRTVTLTRDNTNAKLYTGNYTVQAGDTTTNLNVNSIALGTGSSKPTDNAGNALNTSLPSGNNLGDNRVLAIDGIVPNAVDLDTATGVQNTSTTGVNLAQISVGIAFDADIADATATDIRSIKIVLGGSGLNTANDKLLLDAEIGLSADTNATDKIIGTVGGLEYIYTVSNKTLIISKIIGVFNAIDVAKVVESIQLKNTDLSSQSGMRTATISYINTSNNESISAMASLEVEMHRGFAINGEKVGDDSGFSVSYAGDVNGDGLDDVIIGAIGADAYKGKSYVVFGKTNGIAINLSDIASGTGGFVINGENRDDNSGTSVSYAGDVNGDGLDDLIVGAFGADIIGGGNAGKSYVVFGKTNTTAINLSDIARGTGGFVLNGEIIQGYNGCSVSNAGDVNGDGLDDLIVGAYGIDSWKGKAYVVFGKKDNTTAINLSDIANASSTAGFVLNGESMLDHNGVSVSCAGDVNGDGLDDLIVGAYGATEWAGKSYVIFGKIDNAAINLDDIASASSTGGFVINGEKRFDNSGFSVSTAGDVNGDGLDDLIVGAYRDNAETGKSYVVFGKTNTAAINLSVIAQGTGGFVVNGEKQFDYSGRSVSYAGDVNGDGLDDLIVGASGANSKTGKSYVVFGKIDTNAINLSAIAQGTGGFVINGEAKDDRSGVSVSYAGDVNGDGLDDLIVGAHFADPSNKSKAGKSYVIFGKTDTSAINLSQLGDDSKYIIDFQGTTGNDNLGDNTATNKDELFVAGAGNDILTGNGGMDVFSAGAGNDTIIINASNLTALEKTGAGNRANINGGGGIDTLKLDGSGLTLDLSKISNNRIKDIEKIDLTGSGDNTLKFNLSNVLNASTSTNTLKVLGNSDDKVNMDKNNWTTSSTASENGITYNVYTTSDANADANAVVWIDARLSVNSAPDAVDLSADSGRQSTSETVANIAAINAGIAFDANIQAPEATNIKTIKVVLAGANLSTAHDKLVLDSDLALDVDIATVTGRTIGGVRGLEYHYIASTKTWSISKTSGNLGTTEVKAIVEALKLKNTDTSSQVGVKTATISYINAAGNEGISAMASLAVEAHRGFVINGKTTNDKSGFSVSSAGDVNGDGLDDLIVGAWGATAYAFRSGQSYVVFGKTNGTAVNLNAIVGGVGGFVINGEKADDYSGYSVSSAGDVNGDGLDDLIVGAYGADPAARINAGKSYVVFGKTNTTAINLGAIANNTHTGGFVINGEKTRNYSGESVSSAGDVNGDG